jgi:hypothetical protein
MPSSARDVVEMIKIEVEGQKAAAGFQSGGRWWGGGRCAGIAGRSAPPSGMAFEAGVEAGSTRFVNPIAEFGASPEASFDEVVAQSLGAPAFDADHTRALGHAASTWSMRDVMALDASGRRAHKLSAAQMILNNRDAVTEQEKNDLTHAFQAVDMDSSGRITHSDFALMMKVRRNTALPSALPLACAAAPRCLLRADQRTCACAWLAAAGYGLRAIGGARGGPDRASKGRLRRLAQNGGRGERRAVPQNLVCAAALCVPPSLPMSVLQISARAVLTQPLDVRLFRRLPPGTSSTRTGTTRWICTR